MSSLSTQLPKRKRCEISPPKNTASAPIAHPPPPPPPAAAAIASRPMRSETPQTTLSLEADDAMCTVHVERVQKWILRVELTLAELVLHQGAVERYVVDCLRKNSFGTDDQAYCDRAAAHVVQPAAAVGAWNEFERHFECVLNAILLRHTQLLVQYCAQFAPPYAPYAVALVIRPHALQHLQWLTFHNRIRHNLPDTLMSAINAATDQGFCS